MKKILTTLLITISSIVYAEPAVLEKSVVCDNVRTVFQTLKEDYSELPAWVGTGKASRVVLLVNDKLKTWTLVEFNDAVGCILGSGVKSNMIFIPNT